MYNAKRVAAIAAIDKRLDGEARARLAKTLVGHLAAEPGAPKVRLWSSPDGTVVRVYFPGEVGYLSVTRSGVTDREHGRVTLLPSGLYPAQRAALKRAREKFVEDAADWVEVFAEKRAKEVAALDAATAGRSAGREPGGAPSIEGLAVYVKKDAEGKKLFGAHATLFYGGTFVETIRRATMERAPREAALYEAFEAAIVGVVEVGAIDEDNGQCLGAWEVKGVAGPGLAEVLYGIGFALSPTGLLSPDRRTVSKKAARVWERQFAMGRERVAFEPFSGGGAASCMRYRDKAPALDFAYRAEGWEKAMLRRLSTEGLLAVSRAKTITKATDRDVREVCAETAWNFWERLRPKAEETSGLYHLSSPFDD